MMSTYEESVKAIEEIEASADAERKDGELDISISGAIKNRIPVAAVDYSKAIGVVSSIENLEKVTAPRPAAEETGRLNAPSIGREGAAEIRAGKSDAGTWRAAQNIRSAVMGIEKLAGRDIERISSRFRKRGVLANLSLNDQISELEKISEGIDSGVFTKEQLDTIRDEVNKLYAASKGGAENDAAKGPLISLRDRRLNDVRGKLREAGK